MGVWPFGKSRDSATRFEKEAMPHLDAAYRFARSLTHDPAEADDLVQETYLKALKAFDTFREGTNCRAWLFRILRNVFINRKRTQGREVGMEDGMGRLQASSMAGWSDSVYQRGPEAMAVLGATRDELEKALAEVPREFRTVVVLADVEGLSYKEIAEVMGTPIGTVMSRLYRGRRMMRKLLVEALGNGAASEAGDVIDFGNHRRNGENENGL